MTSLQKLPAEAAKELLSRREARRSLLGFTKYTLPSFQAGEHHKRITDALERVERGECKRLMIFAPPRHTKSELASRRFPAWYLGRNPDKQIICTTYGHSFAADFGRDVRNIVTGEEYGNIFDTKLRADSKSANRWHTDKDGVYISTGVGGAITGRGAHLALIDDPVKNRDEADSEIFRERVWNWYTSTLYTRLMPGGAIVIIMTRWHEDDLAGRLLEDQKAGGEQWEVVNLEAVENEGTKSERALWPEWYDLETLKSIKRAVGIRDWGALYQQNPKPAEGTLFKRDWFNRFHLGEEPDLLNKYLSSDYGVTEDGDFTELGVWGVDEGFNLYAVDWWHGQETADVWIGELLRLANKHKVLCSFGESGVIRRAIEPFLNKRIQKERIFFRQEWIARTSNKVAMSRGFQGLAASGKVFIPYGIIGDRVIDQLCAFPAVKHDDAVDVCALIGLALSDQHEAIAPPTRPSARRDAWGKTKRDSSWRV